LGMRSHAGAWERGAINVLFSHPCLTRFYTVIFTFFVTISSFPDSHNKQLQQSNKWADFN
ncbi:MAG: hypothetical protein P8176_08465, partial [Gammaproteobacteria bacterium]